MRVITKLLKRLFAAIVFLLIAFYLMVGGLLWLWKTQPINNSMFMLAQRLSGGEVTQVWVEYDHIAKTAKQAAIASEDSQFLIHNGFDIDGIEAALEKNERSGKLSAGGSTITQQLAKNLFLTSHRSYIRKGIEASITLMIEQMWDKKRILTAYLNIAEFGDGIYGIEAASQHYFKKSAAKLNQNEAALLISMLTNPKYYETHLSAKRLRNKQRIVMRRMRHVTIP